jgi:hypothetical protein
MTNRKKRTVISSLQSAHIADLAVQSQLRPHGRHRQIGQFCAQEMAEVFRRRAQ